MIWLLETSLSQARHRDGRAIAIERKGNRIIDVINAAQIPKETTEIQSYTHKVSSSGMRLAKEVGSWPVSLLFCKYLGTKQLIYFSSTTN